MQTHELAPDDGQLLILLAKYQLFYNLIQEAEASCLKLKKTMPDDQNIKAALLKIEELKNVPQFWNDRKGRPETGNESRQGDRTPDLRIRWAMVS